MNGKDVDSIVNLLDDPDKEVYQLIQADLVSHGADVIPVLEEAWFHTPSVTVRQRIENIVEKIQQQDALNGFQAWISNGAEDILEGAYWVAKFQYPNLSLLWLTREVEQLRMSIWLESSETLNPFEQLAVVNRVIYSEHGYKVDPKDMQNPELCFINRVIESKYGNPTSMGILYLSVAQRLNLPVSGVCIPNSFLLSYQEQGSKKPDFYINAANRGHLLRSDDIKEYFTHINIKPKQEHFVACSNLKIIARLLQALTFTYTQMEETKKAEMYHKLIAFTGEKSPLDLPDEDDDM